MSIAPPTGLGVYLETVCSGTSRLAKPTALRHLCLGTVYLSEAIC